MLSKRGSPRELQYISEERKDEDSSELKSDYEGGNDDFARKAQRDRRVSFTKGGNAVDPDANVSQR